jgi:predicted sugar kinase
MRFTAATVKRYLPLGSRTTFALAAAAAVNPVRRTTRPVVLIRSATTF